MADPIEPINPNPVTEVRKIMNGALVIERTPRDPVTIAESHDIEQLKAQIAKDQGVVAMWQAKIDILQDIVDEYDAIYAVENPPK